MRERVLVISAMEGRERCAAAIARQLNLKVEIATGRRAALAAVRRGEYCVVLIDESFAEGDPGWADLLAQNSGDAWSIQMNFAVISGARLIREVRSTLSRRERELKLARLTVTRALQNELKGSVTGLLLQSELALREPSVPPALAPKLRQLVELAGVLRQQLQHGL